MSQPSILQGRGRQKTLLPVLRERQQLASHFESLMSRLGLEKREKNITDLKSYVEARYGAEEASPIEAEDQTTDDGESGASGGSDEG